MSLEVCAPVAGTVIALAQVPDPVFAGRVLGPGIALDPDRAAGRTAVAVAPLTGRVTKAHPHAFIVADAQGREVLVHLGIDTVSLEGRGFTVHAVAGAFVRAGTPIITWSPSAVEAGGLSPIVPVLAMGGDEGALAPVPAGTALAAGDLLMTWS
ncbi:PTS glucose transporter subunit IIA [Actinomyces slackii]|uniref:Glucose-specific phosphotransferase enzyme IIA component n=1 Tax=Actinomyces slackii TaxID=52774 RepID=A0A448KCY2_9ACTO|nr:PTS glucose transporter subunit IIA [Actinomyces slackii]VEG74785.1 Glucose-specific phosphotransferase enzyme IIA component [Actinomyces slackii]